MRVSPRSGRLRRIQVEPMQHGSNHLNRGTRFPQSRLLRARHSQFCRGCPSRNSREASFAAHAATPPASAWLASSPPGRELIPTVRGSEFAPHRMSETLRALAQARQPDEPQADDDNGTAGKIAECDRMALLRLQMTVSLDTPP
jgi:hypothetical protein